MFDKLKKYNWFARISELERQNDNLLANLDKITKALFQLWCHNESLVEREIQYKSRLNEKIGEVLESINLFMLEPSFIDLDLEPDLDVK